MTVIAGIQEAQLSLRPRTDGGAATKTRKRKRPAPMLPEPRRAKKRKRTPLLQGPPLEALCNSPGVGALGDGDLTAAMWSWPDAPAGVHQLVPELAPLPPRGQWARPKAGGFRWKVACSKCDGSANTSARWLELGRKPCGGAPWVEWRRGPHDLQEAGRGTMVCALCNIQVAEHRAAEASRQRCPVARPWIGGLRAPHLDIWGRRLVGLVRAWQAFATTTPETAPPQQALAAETPGPARAGPASVRGARGEVDVEPAAQVVAEPSRLRAVHRQHTRCLAGKVVFCPWCGETPRYGARDAGWHHGVCEGPKDLATLPYRVLQAAHILLEDPPRGTTEAVRGRLESLARERARRAGL